MCQERPRSEGMTEGWMLAAPWAAVEQAVVNELAWRHRPTLVVGPEELAVQADHVASPSEPRVHELAKHWIQACGALHVPVGDNPVMGHGELLRALQEAQHHYDKPVRVLLVGDGMQVWHWLRCIAGIQNVDHSDTTTIDSSLWPGNVRWGLGIVRPASEAGKYELTSQTKVTKEFL